MANNCTGNKAISKSSEELLKAIPILRYPKEPVVYIEDLYKRYPQGGEYGWYAFVMTVATFAYWDIYSKEWKLLSHGDLQTIIGINPEYLVEGDIPVWDEENKKFVIIKLSVIGTEDY